MKKRERKILEVIIIILFSAFTIVVAFFALRLGRFVSIVIFGLGLIPILLAYVLKFDLKKLLPDFIFGIIDNSILIIPAILGAELFGAFGALVGAVIGNAVSDAVAGYFEGSISEWLRSKGIKAMRTVLGSSLGKMSGCLLIGIFLIFFY